MTDYIITLALIGTLLGMSDRSLERLRKPFFSRKFYAMEQAYYLMISWLALWFMLLLGVIIGFNEMNNLLE